MGRFDDECGCWVDDDGGGAYCEPHQEQRFDKWEKKKCWLIWCVRPSGFMELMATDTDPIIAQRHKLMFMAGKLRGQWREVVVEERETNHAYASSMGIGQLTDDQVRTVHWAAGNTL